MDVVLIAVAAYLTIVSVAAVLALVAITIRRKLSLPAMRAEGLEPPRLAPPAPKAGVSTNSTTPAVTVGNPRPRRRVYGPPAHDAAGGVPSGARARVAER
jgi:hypothetical protein